MSAWAKISKPVDCSLKNVMSEQLADQLLDEEYEKITKEDFEDDLAAINAACTIVKTTLDDKTQLGQQQIDQDHMIAQLLQLEFDKEFDESIRGYEKVKNRNSKISVTYDKYKIVHPLVENDENEITKKALNDENYLISSSDSDDEELFNLKFKNGVHGKGENMISKHDADLNSRQNASRVMKFPPEFETGDGHGIQMKIPNKVFNELKVHSLQVDKRSSRLHDKEERATAEMSIDPKTRVILYKLVNNDILDSIGGIISTGKEAVILYAAGGKSKEIIVCKECVAKVYKTTLNEFKTRSKYIKDDYRFKDRYKHLNPRKIVRLWAEKEMHNLIKIRQHGILCPEVIMLKKNVLIMSFIGDDAKAAPKLKDAQLNDEELESAYKQCYQIVYDLYNKCNLVHADFSEYNLLWHNGKVWVIDVSQSIENIDQMSLEFLYRDCKNLSTFFRKLNVPNVDTPEELFNKITDKKFQGTGAEFEMQLQKYLKEKNMDSPPKDAKTYNFNYYFEKSLSSRKINQKNDENNESSDDDDDDKDQDE
jgi:RIO kinase 3